MHLLYMLSLLILLFSFSVVLQRIITVSKGLNPLQGWVAGLGVFLLTPLSVMTLNGGFALSPKWDVGFEWGSIDLTNSRFLIPYLMIWTSLMLSFLVTYLFLPFSVSPIRSACILSRRALERVLFITMGIAVLDWALLIRMVGGIETFLISHWYERVEDLVSRYGDRFVLVEHLDVANAIIFTSAAALYTSEGLKNRDTSWKTTSLIVLFLLLQTVMTGNRIFLAFYLLAFLISCWLFRRRKVLVLSLALCPLLVIGLSAWASLRHDLSAIPNSLDAYVDGKSGNQITESIMDATEGVDTLLLMHIVEDFGKRHDYLYGLSYSRSLTSLIPRALYPQKPETFASFLAGIYVPNNLTSLNATALGEMYANFGPATLVLFPLFSLGVVFLNGWVVRQERERGLIRVVLFILMAWVARSTFEDNFTIFLLIAGLISLFHFEKKLYVQLPTAPQASIVHPQAI